MMNADRSSTWRSWRYTCRTSPLSTSWTVRLSMSCHVIVIAAEYVYDDWNPDLMTKMLDQLTPGNVRTLSPAGHCSNLRSCLSVAVSHRCPGEGLRATS